MKRLLLSSLASLALTPLAGLATDPSYVNDDYVYAPFMIDATNFINHGSFNINTANLYTPATPFETHNTRNYTNDGIMISENGWRFETVPTAGPRKMAANFVNLNAGRIQAVDPSAQGVNAPCAIASVDPSYLLVSATNIINRAVGTDGASLIVGANGLLRLTGTNVDLRYSGLEVLPVWVAAQGDAVTAPPTNFIPDVAIHDMYWAQASFSQQYRLNSGAIWDGAYAQAQGVPSPPAAPGAAPGFSIYAYLSDYYITVLGSIPVTVTNFTGSATNVNPTNISIVTFMLNTNIVKGAVFADGPGTVVDSFGGGTVPGFRTIRVLVETLMPNAVTELSDYADVYFQDYLASDTNRGLSINLLGCPPGTTARPINYRLSRLYPGTMMSYGTTVPADFFTSSGNANAYIVSDSVTNTVLEVGDYAAYSAVLDNVVSRPPAVPGATVTNLPGRVRIEANNLDMTRTRIRAEGELVIETANLISSSNAVVDCENLRFFLTATNGNLHIQNLSKDSVDRLRGQIYAWSALWSNTAYVVISNYAFSNDVITLPDTTNTVTNIVAIYSPLSNSVAMACHTLILDATGLTTTRPVNVYELATHGSNVVVSDNMSVVQSLYFDAQSLTLDGDFTIPGSVPTDPLTGAAIGTPIEDWRYANAPNLLYFTNHGYFFIYDEAHFGDDGPRPYAAFVNTGTVDAASLQINSSYVEDRGTLLSVGRLLIQCGTGKLQGGLSRCGSGGAGDMVVEAGDLRLLNYQVSCGSVLYLTVTNSLADAGPGSSNVLDAPYGINLLRKPQTGDLLGTTFQSTAPRFWPVTHTWAAEDRGASAAGYSNNVAVGTLVLDTSDNFGGHFFQGTGANNGLYVDLLDLSALTDYTNQLAMETNLVIYFAAARLSFTPPPVANGIPQQPEEYLDGQFGGHLRWVQSYAGPNSSVAVVINGRTVLVNRALRNSKIIDSDGDGLANYYDATPFGGLSLSASLVQINPPPTKVLAVSWQAAPNTVYQVEFTTNMLPANWRPLLKFTNNVPTNRVVTIWDTNAPAGAARRLYRVGYSP